MNICINCKAINQDSLFCSNCGYMLLIPTGLNYFEIFGLKEAIEVEFQSLQNTYFKLQSAMHPDRFTNKPKEELQTAMANSAVINNAYKVLSDKFKRVQYLVSLHTGLDAKVPPDFMALSFSLHEAKIEGDEITDELRSIETALWQDLSAFIKVAAWQDAAVVIAKLKITARLKE